MGKRHDHYIKELQKPDADHMNMLWQLTLIHKPSVQMTISAQLEGTPYHSSTLYPDPCSSA